jgi:hypothetical protein
MISFIVLVCAVSWFAAAMVGMWVSINAPEYSRKQAIAEWAYMSFICALCVVGFAIGIGVFVSAPR